MKEYSLGLYEKAIDDSLCWEEKLRLAKDAGYDYVEISIDESEARLTRLEYGSPERAEIARAIKCTGMPIRSMCLSGHRKFPLGSSDPEIVARSLDIMQKAVDFASEFGIRLIQLAGYDVYYEPSDPETVERFRRNLSAAAEIAARKGVPMGFETMETEFMNTVGKAMRYVNEIRSPYLGVYPDSGNCTNAVLLYGGVTEEDFELGRGHIFAVHLKESLPNVFREVPYGQGHVNFDAVIRKSWSLGVRMFVTEFWAVGNGWKEEIFRSQKFIDEKIQAIISQ